MALRKCKFEYQMGVEVEAFWTESQKKVALNQREFFSEDSLRPCFNQKDLRNGS